MTAKTIRDKLIILLTYVQNSEEYINRDILTFSAFLDDRELSVHIISHAKYISGDRKAGLIEMMRRLREAA